MPSSLNPRRPLKAPAAPTFRSTFKPVEDLPKEVWSGQQIGQLANRGANVLAAGAADRQRALRERLAGTGAAGAEAEQGDRILQETALAAQNARTEAELAATRDNADWSARRNEAQRANRQQDIDAMLGMGNLELGERGQANERRGQDINRELTGRGQDVSWNTSRLNAGVATRGQDIDFDNANEDRDLRWGESRLNAAMTGRGQDIDWLGQQLGYDVQQRGQDLDYGAERGRQRLAGRGQDLDQWGRRLDADVTQRGQDLDYGAERGRQRLSGRGQDIDWMGTQLGNQTSRRGQTLDYNAERGRQGIAGRGQDLDYDVANRRIDADYNLGRRGQDIGDRNAWADYSTGNRAQDLDWLRAQLGAAGQFGSLGVAQRGQDIGYQSDLYGTDARREDSRLAALIQMLRGGY